MRSRRSLWLLAIPFLLFLMLFCVPDYQWLMGAQTGILLDTTGDRQELQVDIAPTIAGGGDQWYDIERKARETFGSSYADRLIRIIDDPSPDLVNSDPNFLKRREMLQSLAADFPAHRVAVYAYLLARERVWIARDREIDLYTDGVPSFTGQQTSCSPEALSIFDQDAAEGERLDPDNSYFPLMRSAGLFAAHRDAEGLTTIARAAEKSRYDDYTYDEARCLQGRLIRLHGRQGVLPLYSSAVSVSYAYTAKLHELGRIVAKLAGTTEAAGHIEEGFRIRHAMMHCGLQMRVQSRSYIGADHGIALFAQQIVQPCGVRYIGMTRQALTADQRTQRKMDYYCAYLQRIGHPKEL